MNDVNNTWETDPYDLDWQEKEWEQNMYRHKNALKWLEGIMKRNNEYQRDNEEKDND